MVTDGSDDRFEPGDRVSVPWGLDVLDGVVVSTHGEGDARRVVVSVDLPDVDAESGTQIVTLAPSALTRAAAVANDRLPGAWLSAYRYEEELRHALESLFREVARIAQSDWREQSALSDVIADFYVQSEGHQLIVEAKNTPSGKVSRMVVDQLLDRLNRLHGSSGLLVANADLSPEAQRRLEDAAREGYQVRAVKWNSSHDNHVLNRAIQDLLSAA